MDKTALVNADLAIGFRILEILDGTGLRVNVAMWLHTPEYEDWRYALSSRELDETEPSAAYGLVHEALNRAGLQLEDTPPLLILRMNDPFIRALRRLFGRVKSTEGMRLGGQMVGDRFIEDAIAYRIR